MANLGAFYKAGLDYVGRQIVVFVGKHYPATKVDTSKVRSLISTTMYTNVFFSPYRPWHILSM